MCKGYVKVALRKARRVRKNSEAVLNFPYLLSPSLLLWPDFLVESGKNADRRRGKKMGVVEFIIVGLVFAALAGCFVYSILANKQK